MKLVLYHYQNLFYYILWSLLGIRMLLNAYIYKRIDSKEVEPDYEAMESGTLALAYYVFTFGGRMNLRKIEEPSS